MSGLSPRVWAFKIYIARWTNRLAFYSFFILYCGGLRYSSSFSFSPFSPARDKSVRIKANEFTSKAWILFYFFFIYFIFTGWQIEDEWRKYYNSREVANLKNLLFVRPSFLSVANLFLNWITKYEYSFIFEYSKLCGCIFQIKSRKFSIQPWNISKILKNFFRNRRS